MKLILNCIIHVRYVIQGLLRPTRAMLFIKSLLKDNEYQYKRVTMRYIFQAIDLIRVDLNLYSHQVAQLNTNAHKSHESQARKKQISLNRFIFIPFSYPKC